MTILVTGSAGMIGSQLVKTLIDEGYDVVGVDKRTIKFEKKYKHFAVDLGDVEAINDVFINERIDRVIHLAALAHTMGGKKFPNSMYEYLNVECAGNIFKIATKYRVPLLFISTVDVFGFQKGIVGPDTECRPVTIYGKTKYKAEQLLMNSDALFNIFRLSPVYTPDIKRDIQKRIYLKYPKWAYQIGKNTQYEVLSIDKAVRMMVDWCKSDTDNSIRIIKDDNFLNTTDYIAEEKAQGRAGRVIRIPRWLAYFGYGIARISGKNKYTFLLNKAINPLRSK